MLFSEPVFIFFFLPAVLACYYLIPGRWHRNPVLLCTSLFFYAWGEPKLFLLLPFTIVINWAMGLGIAAARPGRARRAVLAACLAFDVLILIVFKYADFLAANLSALLGLFDGPRIPPSGITLPLGISFFTFQAMSYLVDVYRGDVRAQRSLLQVATWKSFFPQLIAGPIIRYRDVADQVRDHPGSDALFAAGVERFIFGLAKKMIIANTAALPADQIFGLPPSDLTASVAWLGVVCYAIQIYFDFSGYSDMALGLGAMFGFRFLENFRYPYAAASVTDFWRRWHISLSSWFRDYLYIPLGGNRFGAARTYANLLIVFALCGLWHGASWSFFVWGIYHGAFLILERLGLGRTLSCLWAPLRHLYLLLVVCVGWVFFRAESLADALAILVAMAGLSDADPARYPLGMYVDTRLIVVVLAGCAASAPLLPRLRAALRAYLRRGPEHADSLGAFGSAAWMAALAALLLVSVSLMAAGTYSPFIYFRF